MYTSEDVQRYSALTAMRVMLAGGLTDVTIPQNLLEDDGLGYELEIKDTAADGSQTMRLRAKKRRVTVEMTDEQYNTLVGSNGRFYPMNGPQLPLGQRILTVVEEPRA